MSDRCPTHPRFPFDDCPICERLIERAELESHDDDPEASDREADRYERWLDETGER